MTQHASLHIDKVGMKHRNVLKRYERVNKLKADERWKEGRSVYGLPKVKSQKLKVVKKAKAEEKDATATGETATAPAAPAAAGKPAAGAAAPKK
jgi:small basic protein (TIGR04137 family)